MDYEETMVEEEFDDVEVDDTLPDDIIEEDESEEEEFPDEEELDIDDLDDDSENEVEEETPADEEPPANEPGWMKKRIGKAVEKAVAAALAQQREEFEQQMRPIRERMIEDEAQALVRSRKVADIETARELVRYRQGQPHKPEEPAPQEQPRNDKGQFVSHQQAIEDARVETRISELSKQADKIKAAGGPDVIKEFTENPDIKRRVVDGELDMYDVADIMRNRKSKKPPTPTRSPNGASNVTPNAFSNMSSKQFARFEQKLEEGGRFTFKN